MAFIETRTMFPGFQRSKDFFLHGIGNPPSITSAPAPAAQTAPTATPTQQPAPAAPAPQPQSPSQQPAPQSGRIDVGYSTQGPIEQRLFQPVQQATQAGQEQLTQFADLFRTQAGPSRTYGGIGAQQTLSGAVEGGPLAPAQELVQARYEGPGGLDPNAAGNLMDLAGRLRGRQQALGTGGGLSSTLIQSAPGTTGGEARFTAQNLLTPDYRARLAQATAGVDPFAQRLEGEILGSQAFAQQRAQEEADIARRSQEYLTGRRAGISGDIQAEIDRQLALGKEAQDLYAQARASEDPTALANILRQAQERGFGENLTGLNTEVQQAMAAAPGVREAILNDPRFASLKDVPLGKLGIDSKGRNTYLLDGKDFRSVLDTPQARLFKERQAALEEAFSPARGVVYGSGKRLSGGYYGEPTAQQLVSPMYFKSDTEIPEVRNYLDFDPGMRPSRGNISTEQQKEQFNRINTILGDLDRISETAGPFKAASILANVDQYLADEEAAMEARKEDLVGQGKEWFNSVKRARKQVRKAKREKEYGRIGAVLGGIIGAAAGLPTAGTASPVGAIYGAQIGGQIGASFA